MRKAVLRGVNVHLLLMMPLIDCAAASARWRDCYAYHGGYEKYDEFIGEVLEKYRKFVRLERELKRIHSKNIEATGKFELRAYEVSLNLPVIAVKEDILSKHVDAVYTGFYTAVDSNDMPYIEWRGGDFKICNKLFEMFEKKWERAKPFSANPDEINSRVTVGHVAEPEL